MFVEHPGISIVAIDPGTTTGVAVWDPWHKKLFIDQIDSGRGRKARQNVWPDKTESLRRQRAVQKLEAQRGLEPSKNMSKGKAGEKNISGKLAGGGLETEMQILDVVEGGVAQVLADIVMAAGPMTVVIIEDFVIGWGDPRKVRSSSRDGLSPVRITARFTQKMEDNGFYNGDAWRDWNGFGAVGKDGRGVKMTKKSGGKPMDFLDRLSDVERWRLGERLAEDISGTERGIWAGSGVKLVRQMPGQRIWLPGGEKACVAWMKENGLYRASAPHAMDAVMHMIVFCRKIGAGIPAGVNRIWAGPETLKGNRVSSKAAKTA